MNANALSKMLITVVAMVIGMVLMIKILSEGWNALSNFYKYALFGGLAISFTSPKAALLLLAVSAGYIDLLKRLMVVAGNVYYIDLVYILAFAPGCAMAAYGGASVQLFLSNKPSPPMLTKLWFISLAFMGIFAAAMLITQGGNLQSLKTVANGAGFAALIFVIPFVNRNFKEFWKFVRFCVLLHIPIALYAFKQAIWGFSAYEITYLETGLSSEIRILLGEGYRVFSTLNSSQTLSKVMGIMAILCLVDLRRGKTFSAQQVWRLPLFLLFMAAAWVSASRTGLIMTLLALIFLVVMRIPKLTIAAYSFGAVALLAVIMNAGTLLDNKVTWEMEGHLSRVTGLGKDGGDRSFRTIQLSSLNARLASFELLSNSDFWTPFGMRRAGRADLLESVKVHDFITFYLVRVGYIPLALIALVVTVVAIAVHKAIWALPKGSIHRRVAIFGLAFAAATVAGGLSATGNLEVYPINYYLYLFIGYAAMSLMLHDSELREQRLEKAKNNKAGAGRRPDMPLPQGRAPGRAPAV